VTGGADLSARALSGPALYASITGEALPRSKSFNSVGDFSTFKDFSSNIKIIGGVIDTKLVKATDFTAPVGGVEIDIPDLVAPFETALQE